jgi:hypothetical protein
VPFLQFLFLLQTQPAAPPASPPALPCPALPHLQTGPVLQAYYRFGPFECDPANPNRLLPASAPTGQPPLILLPGMGATMIAWGTPLLRALACSHEVGARPLRVWPCMPGWSEGWAGQWGWAGQVGATTVCAATLQHKLPAATLMPTIFCF